MSADQRPQGDVTPEERLEQLGLSLPPPWSPGATLVMSRRSGNLLYLSGHMGVQMDQPEKFYERAHHRPLLVGRIGGSVGVEQAMEVARGGALNIIATLKDELGDLSRVTQIVRVVVMLNSVEGFELVHKVADAASDLLVAAFGARGKHSRSSFGVTSLPANSCLAVEALVEHRPMAE